MRFAVVGAGWAGMAAAHTLVQAGHEVTIFEASEHLGGRARGVQDAALGDLDNGQHILIGAYSETLKLIRRAHGTPDKVLAHLPLNWIAADGSISLKSRKIDSRRLRRLLCLATARGLSGRERGQLVYWLARVDLGLSAPSPGQTVQGWFEQHHLSPGARDKLLIPLCLATMNTAPDVACAQLFARVLRDSLLNPLPGAADMLVARSDLTELWIGPLAKAMNVITGMRVSKVQIRDHGVNILNQQFDGCVVAASPMQTQQIARQWQGPRSMRLAQALSQLSFNAISTCYMELDRPWRLPEPVLLLPGGHLQASAQQIRSSAPLTRPGQWVFDRNALAFTNQPDAAARLSFVISHAGDVDFDRQALPQQLLDQLLDDLHAGGQPSPSTPLHVKASRVFSDKRATFAATPHLARPSNQTDWPQLKVAGDWTDTGYPAVLEGAVISGVQAAQSLVNDCQGLLSRA